MEALRAEHIEQRVVERAQIGVDLLLKIAGQESELLARFNCGAGEDYAVDFLCAKSRHRHGDREISFTCAGGSDAESDRVFADGFDIFLLTERFRLDRSAL